MTTPYLTDDISRDEGYAVALPDGRCKAYPDPVSGGEPWTIGFGCTGPLIGQHTVWERAEADLRRDEHISRIKVALDREIPWWRSLSGPRADVLVNMAYNLGVGGLMGFHNTLEAMRTGEYERAAVGMLASRWATQVGARARRLAKQMQTGVRV